jgi:hypothetical protein
VSASIAPAGVVSITPVIPKHANLCTLLSLFGTSCQQPGHQTKDAYGLDGLLIDT